MFSHTDHSYNSDKREVTFIKYSETDKDTFIIPNGVNIIKSKAFGELNVGYQENCVNLKRLITPNSVTNIADNAISRSI